MKSEKIKSKKLKDLAPKLSDAVRAMIEGLKRHSRRKGFVIDMGTFCNSDGEICYGCAALCALQEIARKDIIPLAASDGRSARSEYFNIHHNDLRDFEIAIDQLRRGWALPLVSLYEDINMVPREVLYPGLPALRSDSWRLRLPAYEVYLDKLLSLGL